MPAAASAALAVARVPNAAAIGRAVEAVLPDVARGDVRAAVLVAFGTFLLGAAAGPHVPTPCGIPALTFLTGLAEDEVRTGVRTLVLGGALATAAGPLTPGDVAGSPDDVTELLARVPVLLDPAFLREAPGARLVDWTRVREAAAGSPMALAATRALFDALPQPAHWTPVTLRALTAAMRYSTSVAVTAVRRAVERGIVDERPQAGGASAFRFAPAMLHGGTASPARGAVPPPAGRGARRRHRRRSQRAERRPRRRVRACASSVRGRPCSRASPRACRSPSCTVGWALDRADRRGRGRGAVHDRRRVTLGKAGAR
jgi:hypothetical protein